MSTIAFVGASHAGKSTLAAALSHCTSGRSWDVVDAPASAVLQAIAGRSLGAAVIVVSAVDGPMPDTKAHAQALGLQRMQNVVVFLNKTDLIGDDELVELVEMECRELLSRCGLPGDLMPVLKGSALAGTTANPDDQNAAPITALADVLDAYAPA